MSDTLSMTEARALKGALARWAHQGGESKQVRIGVRLYNRLCETCPDVTDRRNFVEGAIEKALDEKA